MKNYIETVASQYANSPTLMQMIQSMDQYFDPSTDFKNFYNAIWNIDTATGFGLDIWGRIVNVPRTVTISGSTNYFGFSEQGTGAQPFDQGPFYDGTQSTQTYTLGDDAYRLFILTKALANISSCTPQSINAQLNSLFANRGRCYVIDSGGMAMQLTFEFALLPYELSMLNQAGIIAKPAGVAVTIVQIVASMTFGFSEQGSTAQPFNQGVFYNPSATSS